LGPQNKELIKGSEVQGENPKEAEGSKGPHEGAKGSRRVENPQEEKTKMTRRQSCGGGVWEQHLVASEPLR